MSDTIRGIGNLIRLPFVALGKMLQFTFKNFIPILIIAVTLAFIYWFFSRKIYEKLVSRFMLLKDERRENEKAR